MAAILKIRGISKTYPGVRALQEVSFDVERGSIHAIMGENGAGKSTLAAPSCIARPKEQSRPKFSTCWEFISIRTLVGRLTVGQQQLVEICKSLIRSPRLLIFDEPTSSLSEADAEILFRVIHDLKAHGVTMLYISHRFPEVFANCDAVTVLRDGKHVKTLPMKSTRESEVVSLMVGRELLAFHR